VAAGSSIVVEPQLERAAELELICRTTLIGRREYDRRVIAPKRGRRGGFTPDERCKAKQDRTDFHQ
jgi:hypothetical protein